LSSAKRAATVCPAGTLRGWPLTRICTLKHLGNVSKIVGGLVFGRQAGGPFVPVGATRRPARGNRPAGSPLDSVDKAGECFAPPTITLECRHTLRHDHPHQIPSGPGLCRFLAQCHLHPSTI
jgi:hypothetical protein